MCDRRTQWVLAMDSRLIMSGMSERDEGQIIMYRVYPAGFAARLRSKRIAIQFGFIASQRRLNSLSITPSSLAPQRLRIPDELCPWVEKF